MKALKWLLGGVAVVVVLIVAAIVILPMVVPMERIVAEASTRVEAATGRKLSIGGSPELSIWPEVAIRLEQVAFSNAPGAPDDQMATAEAVRIAVPVMPLLSGAVEVKEFVLVKPDIRLFVDAKGKANWDFGKGEAGSSGGGSGGLPDEVKELKLGDVRIEDGRVSFVDAQAGAEEVIEDIDVSISLPSAAGPLDLDGALDWKGERITLDLAMAKPLAAAEAGESALKATVETTHLEAAFDGAANFAKGFALGGAAKVKTPSLKGLAAWAATPIDVEGDVLGPFEADGQLALSDGRIAFTGANIAIDAIRGKGDFALNTAGAVPAVKAKLALGALDLNPYLPPPAEGQPAADGPGKWSEDPIDLSGLKAVNADLDLTVESLLIQQIKIGESALTASLKGGVLDVDLSRMALYGGSGVAKVKLDASKATPTVSKSLRLKGVQAQPLLTDAANFDRLSGKGNLDLTVNAAGVSEAAMVKSADGGGSFAFKNGAITGVNLGAMLRKVESAFLDSSAGKQQKTDFSELTATFKINNGVVTNDDLNMLAPLFRITGKGKSSMPARTVNYRVEPKAVASATGQGGSKDMAGVTVPVLITGPWHNLQFAPDLAGMATDLVKTPGKVLDAAKDVVKDPAGALKDAAPSGDIIKDPAKKLKGLFGK